jgi:uncharacterized protein YndB with AHSA1/START domain
MARGRLGDPIANRAGPRDRVVALRQVLKAPREMLFRAWIDAVEFAKWWGPKGWTAYDCALDARPGGQWRSSFRRPGQQSIHVGGVYHEVVIPELLVFTWDSYGGSAADSLSLVRIEFIALGAHTEIALTHRKLTTGEAEDMDVGWLSAFECLAAYVEGADALTDLKPPSTT